jgi:uncharacterized protein (TIGR02246 family)
MRETLAHGSANPGSLFHIVTFSGSKFMRCVLRAAPVMMLIAAAGIARAQDVRPEPPGASREIRKLLTAMEDSFQRGDARGLAACWTPKGEFVGPTGERVEGRDNIEKAFREFLAARNGARLQLRVSAVRLVSDDVALVEATAEVTLLPAAAADAPRSALVLVKRDGRWWIDSARESSSRTPSPVQHLKDLEWLVGDWADQPAADSPALLHSSCDWTVNRAFLIRKFRVERQNAFLHAGTEVIGWDPRSQRIRSWVFDSSGGVGENVWVQDGKRWLVKYSGTLADGSQASATHVLTLVDANTMTLRSVDRTIGGSPQPDIPAVTIKRQVASKPAVKAGRPKPPPEHVLP